MPASKTQRKNLRVMDVAKGKVLHPHSRRVTQLRRQMRRNIKTDIIKTRQKNQRSAIAARLHWFRDALKEVYPLGAPTAEVMAALAEVFIRRHDAEVEFHKKARNVPKGQIRMLLRIKDTETAQLDSAKGLEVPIATNQDGLKALIEWDGTNATAGKVHTEPVVRQFQSAAAKAEIRELVAQYAPVLLKPFVEDDDLEFDDDDEEGEEGAENDGDDAAAAVDPETKARREKTLGRNKVAKRRAALRQRITAKRAERQGAKATGKVDAKNATGRRLAAQQRSASLRRHKQLAMSRGIFN
jgi:hypothetical protein